MSYDKFLSSWLLWWLMFLWTPRPVPGVVQQQFRRTPDNQTASVGDTVTLACNVIHKAGELQWTRDGFGLGTERNLVGFERYKMVGQVEEGDYTLVIDKVTLEDDAVFQCQVGPGPDGVRELRSPNAKLTIEVPTEPPQIIQGDFLQTTEDREIRLECISRGGKPAAEITWIDGSGQEIKSGVEIIKEDLEDGKRQNTRSILKLIPKKEHHNRTFTCQAHNRPAKEVMSTFIRLQVKYAPKITLKIHSLLIREFENVRISCRGDGNPPEMVYRWFLNDKVIEGDHGTLLVLHNVTREKHEAIVKCEVQNSVGKSEATSTLRVTYGPVFRSRPKNVQASMGTIVTLTCDVEGNPNPEIVWFHEKTRVAVSTSATYNVSVAPNTTGKYICQAVVQGFPEISAESFILLKGPPKILSQRLQFGSYGDTVRLECLIISVPKPDKIYWSHLGKEIDLRGEEYGVLEENLSDGVRSTLVIGNSQEKHFGHYNCSVSNQYGTQVLEILLMRQKSGQLILILTCVIGGVVLVVAVTMISLLCQRKAKKPDFLTSNEHDGVEKQTNKSDRSSNDSDLKVEIRTASSLSNMQEHESEHWDDGSSDAVKNDSLYRYSDFLEPVFPPKNDGHNNNGYVPFANYSRDYNPPLLSNGHTPRSNLYTGGPLMSTQSSSSHPPTPPKYQSNHLTNNLPHNLHHLPNTHNNSTSNSIDSRSYLHHNPYTRHPPPSSSQFMYSNGGSHSPPSLSATLNHHSQPNNLSSSSSSHLGHHINNSSTANLLLNTYGRNGAGPQVGGSRGQSTPSPQYIVPNAPQLKPGTLATHV